MDENRCNWKGYKSTDSFTEFANALRRSSDKAYEDFWSRFLGPLRGFAKKRLNGRAKDKFDADDIVQSVFISFVSGFKKGRLRLDSSQELRGLLALMISRKCRRYLKRYSSHKRTLDRELNGLGASLIGKTLVSHDLQPDDAAALEDELTRVLSRFDEQDREIVKALLDGETTAEIANRFGCSRRTVQRTVHRISEILTQSTLETEC